MRQSGKGDNAEGVRVAMAMRRYGFGAPEVLRWELASWALRRQVHRLGAGDGGLVPAAAGGVGPILCPLAQAAQAHQARQGRGTIGASVLLP